MRFENIITVLIASGTDSGEATLTLEAGTIVAVTATSNNPSGNHNNPGLVRTQILANSNEVVKIQPLENLRSRNIPYNQDGKPIENVAGKTVKVKVLASENFTADTEIDYTFIYEC